MPEAKKAPTAKPASKEKAKIVKAKPAKAVEAKKAGPASKPAAKTVKPKAKVAKVRKPRGPNKPKLATSGSLSELHSLQAQVEKSKVKARKELTKTYQAAFNEAARIAVEFEELFGEPISSDRKANKSKASGTKKGRPAGGKKAKGVKKVVGVKPFTLKEVEGFLEMKNEGIPIKLAGRRSKSIEKLEEAYKQTQDPKEMLEMLK